MELPRGEGRTTYTLCKEVVLWIIHPDLPNGLDVPRGENSSPLQVCEWPIGDRGDRLLSLTPRLLNSFR